MSGITANATSSPGKKFRTAKRCRRCTKYSPGCFWIISIICTSSWWWLWSPSSSPSFVSFCFGFRVLISWWWIFALIMAINTVLFVRSMTFSSTVSPTSQISIIALPPDKGCWCSSCCSFLSQSFSLTTESLGNWSLDLLQNRNSEQSQFCSRQFTKKCSVRQHHETS